VGDDIVPSLYESGGYLERAIPIVTATNTPLLYGVSLWLTANNTSSNGLSWTIGGNTSFGIQSILSPEGNRTAFIENLYPRTTGTWERMTIQHVSGNVGIGSAKPSYKLDVNGDFRATRVLGVDYNDIINIPTIVNSQWTANHTSINYNNGNVGIGVTTPTATLDVSGDIKATTYKNKWMPPVTKMFTMAGGLVATYLDVAVNNVGAKGFKGGFTDGRYIYLVPSGGGGTYYGILTRVEASNYTSTGVSYLDVSTAGNTGAKGFRGGFTDGRFAWLVPDYNGVAHGILTRVDLSNFTISGTGYIDVSAGNTGAKGFHGGFTDGTYVYLVPNANTVDYHGIFTRVAISNFAVSYLDVSTAGNTRAKGFKGGFIANGYAYLVPDLNADGYSGVLTKVDLNNFTTSGVSYLDVSTAGNTGATGFYGGFTDGRYGYLVPNNNGADHDIFTRVDLNNFTISGVTYLNVGALTGATAFRGGFTDGYYAYLVPFGGASPHGVFTRVDLRNFTSSGVKYVDTTTGGNVNAKGYIGGFTDGRFAYLVPNNNGLTYTGLLTKILIGDIFPQGF